MRVISVAAVAADGNQPDGFVPEGKIPVEEAVRSYMAANASAAFAEGRTGTLRPGMKVPTSGPGPRGRKAPA
jgi:predicted amidohydrolase YtcJ